MFAYCLHFIIYLGVFTGLFGLFFIFLAYQF
nr:MAG TPA: hypothetical protein [Caudoviricetes sp.]